MLDPFQPENPDDIKRLEAIQKDVHASFKELVKGRRADKLKGADSELFSGEFWAGSQAVRLGLVDALGDLRTVMREKYGDEVRLRVIGGPKPWWRRRPAAQSEGSAGLRWTWSRGLEFDTGGLVRDALAGIEARSLWSRFGL